MCKVLLLGELHFGKTCQKKTISNALAYFVGTKNKRIYNIGSLSQ
jgi:hypothetical protein